MVKKQQLVSLVESVTVDDLKSLVTLKGKMETLEKKKRELEKALAGVNKQMETVESSIEKLAGKGTRPKAIPKRKTTKKKGVRKSRKRLAQPSLSSVVAEVLGESKKPMKIAELCTKVLQEKKYKTRAKNFKSQLRILLYKNEKGLFKKTGPGSFVLAGNDPKKGKK